MRSRPLSLLALPAAVSTLLSFAFVAAPHAPSRADAGDVSCCEACGCRRRGEVEEEAALFVFTTGATQTVFRMEGDRPIDFAITVFNEEASTGWVNLGVDRATGSDRQDISDVNWVRAGQSAEIVATLGRGDEVELAAPLGNGTRVWWRVTPLRHGERE